MGFWAEYKRNLRPHEVEEPIDIWVHRPLGFFFAKILFPTPITPDQVTVVSLVLGLVGGVCFAVPFRHHLLAGFAGLFLSTVLDCTDGMLARMRKTSSPLGRMLDGLCDFTSMCAGGIGAVAFMFESHYSKPWQWALVLLATGATVYTSSFHTITHDHLKAVYMRNVFQKQEGEGLDAIEARWEEARKKPMSWWLVINWAAYNALVKQLKFEMPLVDPLAEVNLDRIVSDDRRAALFRKHFARPMTYLSRWFGFGMLVFPLGVGTGLGWPEAIIFFRLVILNALFWLKFVPMQRAASRAMAAEMAEAG